MYTFVYIYIYICSVIYKLTHTHTCAFRLTIRRILLLEDTASWQLTLTWPPIHVPFWRLQRHFFFFIFIRFDDKGISFARKPEPTPFSLSVVLSTAVSTHWTSRHVTWHHNCLGETFVLSSFLPYSLASFSLSDFKRFR